MSEKGIKGGVLSELVSRDTLICDRHNGFVRITDPATGRFLFEFHAERDMVIWYERGRRIEIELGKYRA